MHREIKENLETTNVSSRELSALCVSLVVDKSNIVEGDFVPKDQFAA